MCSDIYGKQFNGTTLAQGIARTNTNYGGKGIRATKVIFPNGSIDPWHYLGITKDISQVERAVYISGKCHDYQEVLVHRIHVRMANSLE